MVVERTILAISGHGVRAAIAPWAGGTKSEMDTRPNNGYQMDPRAEGARGPYKPQACVGASGTGGWRRALFGSHLSSRFAGARWTTSVAPLVRKLTHTYRRFVWATRGFNSPFQGYGAGCASTRGVAPGYIKFAFQAESDAMACAAARRGEAGMVRSGDCGSCGAAPYGAIERFEFGNGYSAEQWILARGVRLWRLAFHRV